MTKPQPHSGVLKIQAYKAGDSSIEGFDKIIKLASNESPFGPSPMVAEVIKSHLSRLELYPDGAAEDLKAVLAESEGIASENIILLA